MAKTNGQKEAEELVRSRQSLERVEEEYRHGERGYGKMDLRSYFLQPYHQNIIDFLSQDTGKGKAQVVREIIDEWCEAQLGRETVP